MTRWERIRANGLSLETANRLMLAFVIIVSATLTITMLRTYRQFRELSEATERYIEMQDAADDLRDASDYLTEKVQRFTSSGDTIQMEDYFEEVYTTRRREKAVEIMRREQPDSSALADLEEAMEESVALSERELYAMRLVVEAKGIKDYPAPLDEVSLTSDDAALSAPAKWDLARDMVHDDTYFIAKEQIWQSMEHSVVALEDATRDVWNDATVELHRNINGVFALIMVQTLFIIIMIALTVRLGIRPVLTAARRIREDSPIPVAGAMEFRYLAKSYNKMYDAYKRSIENLNFKASHDALTQVYNREGYDLILSTLDLPTTAMLLVDADHFKEINDTYGHETGDRVLQKIVDTLGRSFRSDDYVCRLGGDELAVLMVHADSSMDDLIAAKVERINKLLRDPGDGVPAVTISAGVAHGSDARDAAELLRHADLALYETKERGRAGCSFYRGTVA